MTQQIIATGQNVTKDTVAGSKFINRYALFNGLEKPRRIDSSGAYTILGVGQAEPPTSITPLTDASGALTAGWYAYKTVYASSTYTRPVAVLDGSINYTRGNPSTVLSAQLTAPDNAFTVVAPAISQAGITHVFLYRSIRASTQEEAEAGPFYYVGQQLISGATVTFTDTVSDDLKGFAVETDNFPPNAYRYATEAEGYIFVGGNLLIGAGYTCTVTPGSSTVTISGDALYDGVSGWFFKLSSDTTGGINGAGLYYANYVDSNTLQLVDANGDAYSYDGGSSGSGLEFSLYLSGNVLRWSKYGEPEAFPSANILNFEGDITGIRQLPNQPLLVVCTDRPAVHVFDLRLIGTTAFKTRKSTISTKLSATSHYSLVDMGERLRAIDATNKAIIEIDGTKVRDVSSLFVHKIFDFLSQDVNDIRLWHCAYDDPQHLFGAFVTFRGNRRMIDFCIGQHTLTGGWFFNFEKDLLCTGEYTEPQSGESMILGGTEGSGGDRGGVWGRIWCPEVYDEWIPEGTLRSGTISGVTSQTQFTVDNSSNDLYTIDGGLAGRWVLVADANDEYAQVGYILSNTANEIVIESVVGGLDPYAFSPPVEANWKFYLGMIECRWGPKKFDFGDPDIPKKVWEIWCCVSGHDESNPPFFRTYRGFEEGYDTQLNLTETEYLDRTESQSLVNIGIKKNLMEAIPRWGLSWIDRSYGPTTLHSLTLVFNPTQGKM